ncbi:MAG: 1-acyl-sn-glycerol-3-phosphate acyltransferase [Bauldia sp.]|nr:1-acyl-sn-glycerol-3-phosphate acyltransferase [Bauldia sp.]
MFRLVLTILVLGIFTLVMLPLQLIGLRRGWSIATSLPYTWQRLAWWLLGMRVKQIGTPAAAPVLMASNHVSWLDITVLAGLMKPLSFVAKSEVASWPVLGMLAKLQRTIFVDRSRRQQSATVAEQVATRVAAGETVVLFAEGTTGDGNRILPFRSALMGAAGAAAGDGMAAVQPVAISYVGVQGIPVGFSDRPYIAWYGDMDFVSHFKRIVRQGGLDVVVRFGTPIPFGPETDRKAVAQQCFAEVRCLVEETRSQNLHTGQVFSPPPKNAKQTGEVRGRLLGQAGEEVVNRSS